MDQKEFFKHNPNASYGDYVFQRYMDDALGTRQPTLTFWQRLAQNLSVKLTYKYDNFVLDYPFCKEGDKEYAKIQKIMKCRRSNHHVRVSDYYLNTLIESILFRIRYFFDFS